MHSFLPPSIKREIGCWARLYNPNTPWSESKNSDCKDWNGHASYLDELMAQIPGKDNYGAKIVVEKKSTNNSRNPRHFDTLGGGINY